ILRGEDLDKLSDKELGEKIKKINVFARVEPKHKIRIVDILQNQGEVVAMTGDGVNDAPAIKSADVGIALGSGSEVTKETADVILLDDNFKTIVEIVKTGRNIFDNIKKVVLFLFSGTFTEFLLIGGPLLFGFPLPVLAGQILWINIIEDTLPAMALSYEKENKEVLKERPRGHHHEILDKEMKFLIFIVGIATDLILLALFVYLYKINFELTHIRTIIFVGLGIDTLFYVFSCKNLKKSIWKYNPFDNLFLNISVLIGWLMLLIAVYIPFFQKILKLTPLYWNDWLLLISLGLIEIILVEIGKIFFIHHRFKKI
ncbi:MAG: HAD-IC family P-type ATPase, partial [Patescibacteria group bacterium]|nr:HAD-IC family P-type ATPase [Patescibacteria group bacterium]